MDSFDRNSRQHVARKMADEKNRGYGPAKPDRRGASLGLGLLIIVVAVIFVVMTSCAAA